MTFPDEDELKDWEDSSTVEDDDLADEDTGAVTDAQRLLRFKDEQETSKKDDDAKFAAQLAEADRLIAVRDGRAPEPEPLTEIEQAAQVAAGLSYEEMQSFSAALRAANERQAAAARAASEGFDADGEPLPPPEPPFSPLTLSTAGFATFMRAASIGAADPSDVPEGFTYDEWSKAVDSAMGR